MKNVRFYVEDKDYAKYKKIQKKYRHPDLWLLGLAVARGCKAVRLLRTLRLRLGRVHGR